MFLEEDKLYPMQKESKSNQTMYMHNFICVGIGFVHHNTHGYGNKQ
jgi:hypothetical protein